MDFRSLTVKELFDNEATAAVVKELAPQLLKYPIKLFNKKSCGEIFDKVVKGGIVQKPLPRRSKQRLTLCCKQDKRQHPAGTPAGCFLY